jgi:hypothetical protein
MLTARADRQEPSLSELSDDEIRRRLTEAAEERARILADPTRAHPVLHPDKYADPIGFDDEGRPLPGLRRKNGQATRRGGEEAHAVEEAKARRQRWWVLHHRAREGNVPVVDFTRRGNEWIVAVRDTPYKDAAEAAVDVVGLYELRRGVQPHEGDLYLKALRQTFANSSRWFVAPAQPAGQVMRRVATVLRWLDTRRLPQRVGRRRGPRRGRRSGGGFTS